MYKYFRTPDRPKFSLSNRLDRIWLTMVCLNCRSGSLSALSVLLLFDALGEASEEHNGSETFRAGDYVRERGHVPPKSIRDPKPQRGHSVHKTQNRSNNRPGEERGNGLFGRTATASKRKGTFEIRTCSDTSAAASMPGTEVSSFKPSSPAVSPSPITDTFFLSSS